MTDLHLAESNLKIGEKVYLYKNHIFKGDSINIDSSNIGTIIEIEERESMDWLSSDDPIPFIKVKLANGKVKTIDADNQLDLFKIKFITLRNLKEQLSNSQNEIERILI